MADSSFYKKTLAALMAAAMAVSAAAEASAQNKEEIPVQAVLAGEYNELYTAYLNGEVEVSEDSGVGIAPYTVPGKVLEPSGALPSSYVTKTTEIRNQGSNNTCWAFSGIGTLEAFLSSQDKGLNDLSEEHLAWWATAYHNNDDGTGWLNRTFAPGGYSKTYAGYFASWQGPKLESDVPYGHSVYPEDMDDYSNSFNVTGIQYVNNDITSIKTAIKNYGAVATSYNNGSGYGSGRKCYYSDKEVTRFSGHAITVIGWDDDYSADNFNENSRPPADGAWLAKNSWGPSSGDEGYLWVSYYDLYAFNTNVWGENVAFTSVKTANPYDKLYQNERYGATYYTYLKDKNNNKLKCVTFANVFDFDDVHNRLESIVFQTLNENSAYTAYYIPVENNKPVADKSKWSYLSSGNIDSAGYIRVNTEGAIIPAGVGAIGIEIDGSAVNDYASIGVDEWLTAKNGDFIFKPTPKKGDSFIINGNEAYDLLDVYANNNDNVGGTLVIKAITTTNLLGDINNDGKSNVTDALLALRYSVHLENFDSEQLINSDVNFDGKITSEDSLIILRRSVNLITDY